MLGAPFWRLASTAESTLRSAGGLRCARLLSSVPAPQSETRTEPERPTRKTSAEKFRASNPHSGFRFIYPEFLPDPQIENRNATREKLERIDMINRRSVIDLPEFYVGSILSVTISDPDSQGKSSRFVGICIERTGYGLRSEFTLRNAVDGQGVEIRYNLYDPMIIQMQVLKLEKRLDTKLHYLRDAPLIYSTFSFDMEPEILPEGAEVPVNRLLVEMKPRPWRERWETHGLKGVVEFQKFLRPREKMWLEKFSTEKWDKYDLMKQYRKTIPEEEQSAIWAEVYSKIHDLELRRKKISRKRVFNFPKKTA